MIPDPYITIKFQCSLILEYCAKGDLRSYLIAHKPAFLQSLEQYEYKENLDTIFPNSDDRDVHDARLLYRWIFQVYILEWQPLVV